MLPAVDVSLTKGRRIPALPKRAGLDPKCRRRDRRYPISLQVEIDGRHYAAADWSSTGMRITGWRRNLPLGRVIDGDLWIPDEARQYAFLARIARIERHAGVVGLEFLEIDRNAPLAMTSLVARRLARARRRAGAPQKGARPWLRWTRLWPLAR
jgi:hypothetical protein